MISIDFLLEHRQCAQIDPDVYELLQIGLAAGAVLIGCLWKRKEKTTQ